jgi:hypothetical protein
VEAVRAALPELDLGGAHPEAHPTTAAAARPGRRNARRRSPEVAGRGRPDWSSRSLWAEAQAPSWAPTGSGLEIGIRLGGVDGSDRSAHPDLALDGPPPERQGRPSGWRPDPGPCGCAHWCRRRKPRSSSPRNSTKRLDGSPVSVAVARAMASGSGWPAALASSNHRLKLADGVGIEVLLRRALVRSPGAAGPGPRGIRAARYRDRPRSKGGPSRSRPPAKRSATAGLRSSKGGGRHHLDTRAPGCRSTARSSDAPVDTTSSTTTTRCRLRGAGALHPGAPAVPLGFLADREPRRPGQHGHPVGEGVGSHGRAADRVEGAGRWRR